MLRLGWFAMVIGAMTLLNTGCAPVPPAIVPASGVVTINGKPLPGAEIQFVPLIQGFGAETIATALSDENGRFELQVMGKPGACATKTRVTVSEGPLPENARGQSGADQMRASRFLAALKNRPIPPKYSTQAQSPIEITVSADKSTYDLELTR